MRGALFTAWLASIGLVSWRAVASAKRPPLPNELVATVVVYGTLSLAPEGGWLTAATYLGWGLVVANVLGVVDTTNWMLPGQKGQGTVRGGIATVPGANQPKGALA